MNVIVHEGTLLRLQLPPLLLCCEWTIHNKWFSSQMSIPLLMVSRHMEGWRAEYPLFPILKASGIEPRKYRSFLATFQAKNYSYDCIYICFTLRRVSSYLTVFWYLTRSVTIEQTCTPFCFAVLLVQSAAFGFVSVALETKRTSPVKAICHQLIPKGLTPRPSRGVCQGIQRNENNVFYV